MIGRALGGQALTSARPTKKGRRCYNLVSHDSQAALWTLMRTYSGILEKIEAIRYDVLAKRNPGLSAVQKAWIMLRAGTGLWKAEPCLRHT